jgi:hypothetical protein
VRIVLNARVDDPSSRGCIVPLHRRLRERGVDAVLGDWHHYEDYDVAIFLAYDQEMEVARRANPRIRIGLADPKQTHAEWIEAARQADFLVVGSIEQREAFLRLNRNIVVVSMFPLLQARPRKHSDRSPLVVAYHGNRIHLESLAGGVRAALEAFGRSRPIELRAVYNIEAFGRAGLGLPDPAVVPTVHIPWTEETEEGGTVSRAVIEALSDADIGLVPSLLPIRDRRRALRATAQWEPWLAYEPFDHLVRYKASTNAGRLYPFARLGVPVVCEPVPSSAQVVVDGVSGFLAGSAHSWYDALDRLAADPDLRTRLAASLAETLESVVARELQQLLEALAAPLLPAPPSIPGQPTAESDLDELAHYASPARPAPLGRRLWTRVSGGTL